MKYSDIDLSHIVALMNNRVSVKKYFYDRLPKDIRALAFTVSNLETLREIEMVKRSLANAIEQGQSFKSWRDNLNIEGIKNLSNARLENVYRTNINTVYNQASRVNAYESGITPYMMYTAVGDERTRPEHMALDGTVKPVDSSFWDKFTPPIAFNCRCGTIPLDEETVKEMGVNNQPMKSFPEPEFGNKKMGDVLSSVTKTTERAIESLPKKSPYRQKFMEAQDNIKNLVDVWFNKNKDIFNS